MRTEEKRDLLGMKQIKCVFAILVAILLGYFILGEVFLEPDVVQGEYRCEEFEGEWFRVNEDGTRSEIAIPGKYEAERNEKMTVETTLPENIRGNSFLCFRSAKQEMHIYVDGVLRQEYSTKDTRLFGKISAVAYIFLELKPEDAGKTLTLDVQTDSSYSGMFYTVYFGDRLGVWNFFFKQYGVEIIVAFFCSDTGTDQYCGGYDTSGVLP